jgi:G:T-mismatch repair DNA endonuclease (very short patch repair protein)
MALLPYIKEFFMSGYRRKDFYIKKYGLLEGERKYNELLSKRENRLKMRNVATEKVECKMCGKLFKRITKSHLKNKCVESITTHEYLTRFPNAELIAPDLKKLYSNTKESIKNKWGEQAGEERWGRYIAAQAKTNSFEYKSKNYSWSNKEYKEYNKSRAATIDNFIARHGEEVGLTKWEEYCDRQRYTTSQKYFIEKYGYNNGVEKYDNFANKRSQAKKNQSKIELEVFNALKDYLESLSLSVRLSNIYYGPFDYGCLEKKKLIEFYGTYWHTDPRFYNEDFVCSHKGLSARKIRSRDRAKRTYALNQGYQVFVIWEHDWRKNKEKTLENIIRWWNE